MNRRLLPGVLLILALALRAVIPDGFMPAMGKAGMAHMMVCPGMAAMEHGDAAGKGGGHANCPYSPVLLQGLAGYIPVIIATPVYREIAPVSLTESLADVAAVKPWLSQGPPRIPYADLKT